MRVCMRVCVRVRARARTRTCICVPEKCWRAHLRVCPCPDVRMRMRTCEYMRAWESTCSERVANTDTKTALSYNPSLSLLLSVSLGHDSSGSVVVESLLQIDGNKTDNPEGQAAKGFKALATAGTLTVNGTAQNINSLRVGGEIGMG